MKNPHEDWSIIDDEELKRRINRFRGKKSKYSSSGRLPKSTKIYVWDIAPLADVYRYDLFRWLAGKRPMGNIRKRRLSRIVRLLEAGMITKSQYGKYTFHVEPVNPPPPQMKISLGSDGISISKVSNTVVPKSMPDFKSIFGRK